MVMYFEQEWKTVGGRRNKENCRGNPASLVQPGRGGGQRGRSQGRGQREARGGRGRGSSVDSGLGRGRVFGRQEQVPSLSTNQGNVSYIGDGKQVYASEKLNINKSGSNSLPDRGAGDVG